MLERVTMADPSVDIEKLFEPGYEETLSTYLRLLHPADTADLFHYVSRDKWGRITSLPPVMPLPT